jgi:plastocyanin
MKTNILLFILYFLSISVSAQKVFNNAGGDSLFSNSTNWAGGSLPISTDKIKIQTVKGVLILDNDYTVKQVIAARKGIIIKSSRTFNIGVTASGNANYILNSSELSISNQNDPDISVNVGDKLVFDATSTTLSNHPFAIVSELSSLGAYDASKLISGVTNNGTKGDTITWDLSGVVPGTYYYICTYHKNMVGQINVSPQKSLTITGNGNVGQPIQANGDDSSVDFQLPVIINTTDTQGKQFATNGARAKIFFNSSLTNNTATLTLANPNSKANTAHHINGKFISDQWLNINANTNITFGDNSDFSGHASALRFIGNAGNGKLIVSSDKNKFKTSGTKIIITTGGHMTINTEDILKSTLQIDSDKVLNLTINNNQSNAGLITMTDSAKINLSIDPSVTSFSFADNSGSSWGNGKIIVTGFKDDVLSFGSSVSGLTTAQLSQIDVAGTTLEISSTGSIKSETPPDISVSTFTNGSGDKLWSNSLNWNNGIPNVPTAKVTLKDSLILDKDVSIAQIKLPNDGKDVAITSSNNSKLTLTGSAVTQPVQNNAPDKNLTFDLKVDLTSNDLETIQINGGGTASINFGSNSELSLAGTTKFVGKLNRSFSLNGKLIGSGALQVGDDTNITFGSSSDNLGYTGEFKFLGANAQIIANTIDDGTFISNGIFISPGTASNPKLILNGINIFKGDINILDKNFSLLVNANQSSMGELTMGSGNLNLSLDASVSQVAFSDNSSSNWGDGKVVISGFKDNVISFGTSSNGITTDQLNKIDIGGTEVIINSSGKIAGKVISQSTFTNAGGDMLWSNVNNWSNGIPNVSSAKVILNDSLILDKNVEIAQIKLPGGFGSSHISSVGNSALTLNGSGVNAVIQNNGSNIDLRFELDVKIRSNDSIEGIQVNAGGSSRIIFRNGSSLDSDRLISITAGGDKYVMINDTLKSSGLFGGGITIMPGSKLVFGENATNKDYMTYFTLLGNAELISRIPEEDFFVNSDFYIKSLDINNKALPNVVTVENGYTMRGGFKVESVDLILNLKASQHMEHIDLISGNLILNFDSAAEFPQVSFPHNGLYSSNNSNRFIINGFKEKVFSFGSDSTGLSPEKLALIMADSSSVGIDGQGYLYIIMDSDGDGVVDSEDSCPNTPDGEIVDSGGCSISQKDSDGDGVNDNLDACPNTPLGAVVDSSGCEIPLSIESIKHINKIYPIPADNTLTIEFRENIKVDHIYLVGMNGNLQKSLTFIKSRNKADVNVSGIDSGIYILNIITEKDILKVKVIIER